MAKILPDHLPHVQDMYKEYFLDYASYVITDRAVPYLVDGLKPVQRRILHSLREMEDGRFHKVANVIGQTMKFHPHGDAAIGDALVGLGQKGLLIDTQGNWGDPVTGDSAAAARYIEAKLSKFALEVAFNASTTTWQRSYDGRNLEPVLLPMKFPLVLAQGAEGIAVGLSTRIMPHNFREIIDCCIKVLKKEKFTLLPDFLTGGQVDASQYNDGQSGGRLKVRAKIVQVDDRTLSITEVPYGVTTGQLIESIVSANEKGKIKVKKIEDKTAKDVEITVHLPNGSDPDKAVDAMYAFTDCEVSVATNCCVILENKPVFLGVSELLELSVQNTVKLLRLELEIQKKDLQEKHHFKSLERIFIEERIYRKIEIAESWDAILQIVDKGLKPFRSQFLRDVTDEDIKRLVEIPIRRISRYDANKAQEELIALDKAIAETEKNLKGLTKYAIAYYENLLTKYGKGRERRTKLKRFSLSLHRHRRLRRDPVQPQGVHGLRERLRRNGRQERRTGRGILLAGRDHRLQGGRHVRRHQGGRQELRRQQNRARGQVRPQRRQGYRVQPPVSRWARRPAHGEALRHRRHHARQAIRSHQGLGPKQAVFPGGAAGNRSGQGDDPPGAATAHQIRTSAEFRGLSRAAPRHTGRHRHQARGEKSRTFDQGFRRRTA